MRTIGILAMAAALSGCFSAEQGVGSGSEEKKPTGAIKSVTMKTETRTVLEFFSVRGKDCIFARNGYGGGLYCEPSKKKN